MATVGNLFLLLKKQRLIIIEVDLQNAQLYNDHMIPSNSEIEVKKRRYVGMFSIWRKGYVNSHPNCEFHHCLAENLWRHQLIS